MRKKTVRIRRKRTPGKERRSVKEGVLKCVLDENGIGYGVLDWVMVRHGLVYRDGSWVALGW